MTQPDAARIALADLTSNQLDQLYGERDWWHKAYLASREWEDKRTTERDQFQRECNEQQRRAERAEAERDALIDERDKLDRQLTTMTDVARGNLKHVQTIVPELEAATQRAERAEAAIERVRAIATNMRDWDGDHPAINRWATDIRTALDEQQEQP